MSSERFNNRGYLFLAPATIYLAIFSLFPILWAGWIALHRWHLLKEHERPFVGFDNFVTIASDPAFRNAIRNTLIFVAAGVPLAVVSSLAVALLVAQPLRGIAFFRTVFYIPAVASQVALSMVWTWILMPATGLLNTLWSGIGTGIGQLSELVGAGELSPATVREWGFDGATDFLQTPGLAMAALIAMFLWISLGPRMVIFLAGLQSIPGELYEAASLDGAGRWRRFISVTLPTLLPTTLFVTVTTTIAAFQIFTPVYVLTRGGPQGTTDVVLYHIYAEAWQKFELGTASAMSYGLLAMILIVAAVQLRLMRRGLEQGGG